jgi:hypothetical protein
LFFFEPTWPLYLKFNLSKTIYFLKRTWFLYVLSKYHGMFKMLQWNARLRKSSLFKSSLCGTVSKVFEKSNIAISSWMLLSKLRSRFSVLTKSCVVHEYPDLNPWLRLVNILWFSKCAYKLCVRVSYRIHKLKILVYNLPLHGYHLF